MDDFPVRIKLYGVRGSYVPSKTLCSKYGKNTISFRVDIGNHILIFDAGSGIINCGQELMSQFASNNPGEQHQYRLNLFFTHYHIDHISGLPYFQPLYDPNCVVNFYAPKILDWTIEKVLAHLIRAPFFPFGMDDLTFQRNYFTISQHKVIFCTEDEIILQNKTNPSPDKWLLKISLMRNFLHPKGGSYFYRLEKPNHQSVVFAYDTEGYVGGDQRLIKFATDANVLFHDAQYTEDEYMQKQGYGHSTYVMACDVAKKANVGRLYLLHHDPEHDDKELEEILKSARKIFPKTDIAKDNLEFVL